MSEQLFTLPRVIVFDANGALESGAKANFYIAGTLTRQNTFTDSALTTPHANPVVADANGVFAPIYLDAVLNYKVDITDSLDISLSGYPVDNLTAALTADEVGRVLYPTTFAESSASITPSDFSYPPGNVLRYGATGDGVTDDTTAIQNALLVQFTGRTSTTDGASNTFGYNMPVYFPEGTYLISATLDIKSPYAWLKGDRTILSKAGSFTGTAAISSSNQNTWRVTIEGLQFEDFATGLYLDNNNQNSGQINIRDCGFFNITNYAIHLDSKSTATSIESCIFRSCVHELYVETGDLVTFRDSWISRGVLTANNDGGIIVESDKAVLRMHDIVCVPTTQTVTEPCWIRNLGTIICRNVRFGGETGAHTAVNNYFIGTAVTQDDKHGVYLHNCDLYIGSSQPAVRLFEIPNVIYVEACRGLTGANSTMVDWSSTVDGATQTTKIGVLGTTVIRHGIYLRGNTLPSTIPTNLDFIADYDAQRLIPSASGDGALIFDFRQSAITATEVYGRVDWDGQDGSGNASGTRAQIRTEATATAGGVKTVIANAANSSASLTDILVVDENGLGISTTSANTNTPSGATARELPIYDESGSLLGYIPIYGSQW